MIIQVLQILAVLATPDQFSRDMKFSTNNINNRITGLCAFKAFERCLGRVKGWTFHVCIHGL